MADSSFRDPNFDLAIFRRRIILAMTFVLILASIIVYRYYDLQVVQHGTYATQSDANRIKTQPLPPRRGLIYDRNGQLIADNQPVYNLTIVPELIDDFDKLVGELRQYVEITDDDVNEYKKRLRRHRRPYEPVVISHKLNSIERSKLAVNEYLWSGVEVRAELVRHYPFKGLFAHSVGYVGRINERELRQIDPEIYASLHTIGKTGVEKIYEEQLVGQQGSQDVETDARGRVLRVLDQVAPTAGSTLQLHLDANLQHLADRALGDRRGAVVAIDVATGGVLAAVSKPAFDPNLFVTGISFKDYAALRDDRDIPLFNRMMQGQYPPGSTVKPIIALAGLVNGTVTTATKVRDPGYYILPGEERRFRDWKPKGHGHSINLHQAIAMSCDTYYYDMGYKLGIDKMSSFIGMFGLGERTGVEMTSERPGILPSREWKRGARGLPWFPGDTLNVSIGQGDMLMTPMQLASSTAILAGKGRQVKPMMVKAINGVDVQQEGTGRPDVTLENDKHWNTIFKAMEAVNHSYYGTARQVGQNSSYRVAGKTGTAQVVGIGQDEKYDELELEERQRDHALYVGFAPADNPVIAVSVIVENGEGGSSVAAPLAKVVLDGYLLDEQGQMRFIGK